MRILVHALAALEIGGSDRHLRGMLSGLEKLDPDDHFLIYVNNEFPIASKQKNIEIRSVPMGRAWNRLFWDQITLPKIVKKEGIDVIWATLGFSAIKPPAPQIIFQRNAVYYSNIYSKTLSFPKSILNQLRRWLLLKIMISSSFIITPTQAMRDMILADHPGIMTGRFKVIPHAFSPKGNESKLPAKVAGKLNGCLPGTVKLLYVGYILPEKGLFNLLEAYASALGQSPVPLKFYLTISRDDWAEGYDLFVQKVAAMGLNQDVEIIGKVPPDCMDALYQRCDVLVYPSICESFGFPLYEARRNGLPIIAVDTPVNREGAGEGALYYSPSDPMAIASKIGEFVNDPMLRKSMGIKGKMCFENNYLEWAEYCRTCLELSKEAKAKHPKPTRETWKMINI